MSGKKVITPSVPALALKEQYDRGAWLLVAIVTACVAFFGVTELLRYVWADWIRLFRDMHVGNTYVGGLVCTYSSAFLANMGQETIWWIVMLPIYVYRPAVFEPYRINPKPASYSTSFYAWSFVRVFIVNNMLLGFFGFIPLYFQVRHFCGVWEHLSVMKTSYFAAVVLLLQRLRT
jgi:hypothetical protein